jgi:hypothetical protein
VEAVAQLEAAALPGFVAHVAALLAAASARMATTARLPQSADSRRADDHLLDITTAAERLGVTPAWLRRRPTLPFVVKLSDGVVRYSARGLARFIQSHTAEL